MSKEYEVKIPIAGHIIMTLEADSEEAAIEKAMNEATLEDIESWEALEAFTKGNVCYCPKPWAPEATLISESLTQED